MSSTPEITIANISEWQMMEPMEMRMQNTSDHIFPILKYNVANLDPSKIYRPAISFERVDDYRYKLRDGKWGQDYLSKGQSGSAEPHPHRDGPQTGEYWMRESINFYYLRISSKKVSNGIPTVILEQKCLYQPRLLLFAGDTSEVLHCDVSQQFIPTSNPSKRLIALKRTIHLKNMSEARERLETVEEVSQEH